MKTSCISKKTSREGGSIKAMRTRVIGFCALCVLPLIVAFNLSDQLSHFLSNDATFSYLPLIPLASLFVIYQKRKSIFSTSSTRMVAGLPTAVGVLLAFVLQSGIPALSSSNRICAFLLALMLTWIGAFGLCFGKNAFKAARFPLFFLILAIPIPDPPLSGVISFLQYGSADVAEFFFRLGGVPYLRQDLIFHLPSVSIRVAEECSGIRSTLALLITAVLASYLFLQASWRRLILCLAVVPLAIFKNGLRIMVLSTLAIYVDPGFLHGNLHHHGGVVFFTVALMVMGLLFLCLQKGEKASGILFKPPALASSGLAKPLR